MKPPLLRRRPVLALGWTGAWAQVQPPVHAVGALFARIFEPEAPAGARGLAVDLLRRVYDEGLRFEFMPYPRAQLDVEQGDADLLVGPYRTPEREGRFLFSQRPFYEDAMIFYARRGSAPLWTGHFPALARLSLGAVKGWAYGGGFEAMRPYLQKLTLVSDVQRGLQMLSLGRIELFATNERNTRPVLEQLRLQHELLPQQPPLDMLRGHFGFTRSARGQALRQRYDQRFEELLRSGEFARMAQRWGLQPPL